MNENEFIENRTGKLAWESQGLYFRFEPSLLPFEVKETPELSAQAQRTIIALGRLDGMTLKLSPAEILLFQTPFMVKEAQLSSEIEGTRSTLSDVYKEEKIKELDPEKKLDNEEIRNYKIALLWALTNLPENFSHEYIQQIHTQLLQGVRGSTKEPGHYKTYQNAIGKRSDSLDSAKFVPASAQSTPHLMQNLLTYINQDTLSALYRIGIIHYQFEAIHPFRDGNGRLGRMLIVLQLRKEKILQHPLLYISEYLTRNKDAYIDLLYQTSMKGNLEEWLMFFLKALEVQAKNSLELLIKIDNYKQELHEKVINLSQSQSIHQVVDILFKHPYIVVNDVKNILGTSQPTAWNLVKKLVTANILQAVNSDGKMKVYVATRIIDILEGRD